MSDETEKLTTEHIIAAKSLMNEAQVPKDAMSNIREFEAKWAVLKNCAIEVNDASLIVNMPNKITEKQKKVQALVDAASEIACKLDFDVKPEGIDNELRALDEAIVSCEAAFDKKGA